MEESPREAVRSVSRSFLFPRTSLVRSSSASSYRVSSSYRENSRENLRELRISDFNAIGRVYVYYPRKEIILTTDVTSEVIIGRINEARTVQSCISRKILQKIYKARGKSAGYKYPRDQFQRTLERSTQVTRTRLR